MYMQNAKPTLSNVVPSLVSACRSTESCWWFSATRARWAGAPRTFSCKVGTFLAQSVVEPTTAALIDVSIDHRDDGKDIQIDRWIGSIVIV